MSLNDLLNTDLEVVGARARQALGWWLDELRELAGPLLRKGGRREGLSAERTAEGGYRLLRADGMSLVHRPGQGRPPAAALVLPADAVVVRAFPAPPLPERDIRRAVLLDLDRLTPFPAETVYPALAVAKAETSGGRARVTLGVIPRAWAERELADARAAGLEVTALVPHQATGAALDFLPAIRAGETGSGGLPRMAWAWLAVAVLLAANVGAAVWRDVRDTSRLQAAVAAQQPVVERVQRLRRRAKTLSADARERAAALVAGDPLRVLDALSRAVPDQAYAQRLAWDGATVRIAGQRHDGAEVAEAMRREPIFTDVRNTDASASASDPAFDIAAAVRRPPGAGPAPVPPTKTPAGDQSLGQSGTGDAPSNEPPP